MRRFGKHFLGFVGAALFTFVLTLSPFWKWESRLYDLRVKLAPRHAPNQAIVLIGIDDQTLKDLHGKWPLPAKPYIDLLKITQPQKPFATAFLFPMHRQTTWNEADRAELGKATKVGGPVYHSVRLKATGADYPDYPLPNITPLLSFTLKDSHHFAKDRVARRGALWFRKDMFLEYELANLYLGEDLAENSHFMWKTKDVDGGQTFITRYAGPKNTFPIISMSEILTGKIDPSWFKNKIILIGPTYTNESENFAYTPFSRQFEGMSRPEIQANVIQTLLEKSPVIPTAKWIDYLVTFGIASLTLFVLFALSPVRGLLFLFLEASVILLLTYLSYILFNVWVIAIHPLLTVFLCYYFFLPYRLIIEDRRRWKYQKRSELLGQVEQLKTNFMSLISHDLKTPVARIQGMAERALAEPKSLSGEQKESLSNIIRSSEELISFISNILDLTRVETNKVQLRKTSKDINQVIEGCTKSLEYLAKEKQITTKLDLEPLFSFKFDTDLIKQAVSNLVVNAYKYSPEGSNVTIRSREVGNKIKVEVEDSGPGLSELDLENVFTKFYRGKNDQTAKVKGTGLGLYLVKYFIELHRGSVAVESSKGKGATFWFTLPLEG
ncbi:CHASE2 domain-containing protein [Bdellovibrionota bacterium]